MEYMFGVGRGRIGQMEYRRIERIARKHGADFVSVTLPGDGPRYWFAGPDRGEPFNGDLGRAVLAEVGTIKIKQSR